MEINRNQYFMAGLIVLFLGLQLRLVDTYVLNEKSSKFLAERMKKPAVASTNSMIPLSLTAPISSSYGNREIHPPKWLGFALLSVGAVLVLHSLAMNKPE